MTFLFDSHPRLRWTFTAVLFLSLPAFYAFAEATGNRSFLTLGILPALMGLLWIGRISGSILSILVMILFLIGGLREPDNTLRPLVLFNIPILLLTLTIAVLYRHRSQEEANLNQEKELSLAERLTLVRQQYQDDFNANDTNQKKFKNYSLLNRVSKSLGSQLQLAKLADVVMQNMRNVMGAERGSYLLAFNLAGQEKVMRSVPENRPVAAIQDDQYGLWATQHRTALLVADTTRDFRFQSLGVDTLLRSLMVAPLLVDGKVVGFLRAESSWAGMFTTDDLRLFTILADLTALAAENARLYQREQELAITDGLTNLYLRRFFEQRFEEELERFREHGIPFTLLILDLDHFKRINDRLGHLAGDQILVQLAKRLQSEVRVADILCRYGGEEFAILLPNTQLEGAVIMAERIRTRIGEEIFHALDEKLNMTISIGLGECPRHADNIKELIRVTDEALYTAKRNGRNQVVPAKRSEA